MANYKVSKQKNTTSSLSMILVGGLTGLAVAPHFPKVTGFVKYPTYNKKPPIPQKNK